jgi:hypothetical protein
MDMETILIAPERFKEWIAQPLPYLELKSRLEALKTLRPVKVVGQSYAATPKGLAQDLANIERIREMDQSYKNVFAATYDRIILILRANEQAQ